MGNITVAERQRRAEERAAAASVAAATAQALNEASGAEIQTPGGRRITRETRKGFGSQTQKLAYPQRPGYHRHWFNDTPGRIAGALESGYTHVQDPITKSSVQHVVGVTTTGGPLTAYLLEIPQEWWEDDMAETEKVNAAKEESIRRGAQAMPGAREDQGAFYPQAQGRRIQISRG